MPLFGGTNRPRLDGLTKDEEKRRDALNPEVLRRAGEKGVAGQAPAAMAVLREKMEQEPNDFLWPCLLGWQYASMGRFVPAIHAFDEAVKRDANDVRAYYGAGRSYFEAAETKLKLGPTAPPEATFEEMTVDNMYHEAGRYFRRALELVEDKKERDQVRTFLSSVEKAVAKKAGRL